MKAAVDALERIDWDFPGAGNDPGSIHKVHWFPGNFIPQIPTAFIQTLSKSNALVFDPFGGSGTTAIEALRLGRRAIISDRVSACVAIMSGKLSLFEHGMDTKELTQLLADLTWQAKCRSDEVGQRGEGSNPALEHWYSRDTLRQLKYLWALIEKQKSDSLQEILTLAFSDTLFACASPGIARTSTGKIRRHHWGWVADNVRPRHLVEHNAIAAFEQRLISCSRVRSQGRTQPALVLQQDARRLAIKDNSVDLVVTSPPYIGMIDYTRSNRLLYDWMGWENDEEKKQEIGARFKRQRFTLVEQYLQEMRRCGEEIYRVLKPKAYCAIVIGESRKFPGVAAKTVDEWKHRMPVIWGPVTRRLSRQRVSERGARETHEYLCVFQKI